MIRFINQLVTHECNGRCRMCRMWTRGPDSLKMTPREFSELYGQPEWKGVKTLIMSGGEPTLRDDIESVLDGMLTGLAHLRTLFFCSNGLCPQKVVEFAEMASPKVDVLSVVLPLEGNAATHALLRGVDGYDQVIQTLRALAGLNRANIRTSLSMTLQPLNCNSENLEHVQAVACETGSSYSFRPAARSEQLYANEDADDVELSVDQVRFLLRYIKKRKRKDSFMWQLHRHLRGKTSLMGDRRRGIRCLAGRVSVFIQSDGTIRPCIYSDRVVGDKTRGLYDVDYAIGSKEPCPCCTECQVLPMLAHARSSG